MSWPVTPLAPGVRLRITREMPALRPDLEAIVAVHWKEATAERPLFNGQVFSADEITESEITGHWTEYRRATAQMRDPDLFQRLGIRNLAVCGVVLGPSGVLVGRREPNAAYQAGEWQLAPAGSVDFGAAEPGGADWRIAILAELHEELGLDAADITAMRPLCLVQHPTGVLDMGIRIDTPLDADALLARHQACGDREYDRLLIVPPAELEAGVGVEGGTLVPSALPFLAHALAVSPAAPHDYAERRGRNQFT